ncbi:MAG: ferritin-like domain-containing protein [Candidatus Bathyarchaeia archaeon]
MGVWQKVDDETLEMLKEQKTFEDETAEKLSPLYKSAQNPLVKLFIHRIILDTKKHSDTYQLLIDLNRRSVVGEVDRKKMSGELSGHIGIESKMMEKAVKIAEKIEDENTRRILEEIVDDEKQHHQVLKDLFEMLKKEGEDWNRYLYDMFVGGGIP